MTVPYINVWIVFCSSFRLLKPDVKMLQIMIMFNFVLLLYKTWIAQSVKRLATGWTVRGSNPRLAKIIQTRPDRSWGSPSPCTTSTGSFLGVKRRGGGGGCCWPPTPSRAEVKERVKLQIYSSFGPSWPVLGWPLPLPCYYTGVLWYCVTNFIR
jgi:hypothetical protein